MSKEKNIKVSIAVIFLSAVMYSQQGCQPSPEFTSLNNSGPIDENPVEPVIPTTPVNSGGNPLVVVPPNAVVSGPGCNPLVSQGVQSQLEFVRWEPSPNNTHVYAILRVVNYNSFPDSLFEYTNAVNSCSAPYAPGGARSDISLRDPCGWQLMGFCALTGTSKEVLYDGGWWVGVPMGQSVRFYMQIEDKVLGQVHTSHMMQLTAPPSL